MAVVGGTARVVGGGVADVVDVGRGSVVAGVSVVEGATDVAGEVVGEVVSTGGSVAGGAGGMVSATVEEVVAVDDVVGSRVVDGSWTVVDSSSVVVVV